MDLHECRSAVRKGRRPGLFAGFALGVGLIALAASPAYALKIVTWNLLNYTDQNATAPINTITPRQDYFRTVLQNLSPDLMVVQEMKDASSADSFLFNVLRVVEPARNWSGGGSHFISTAESAVFFDPQKVAISNLTSVSDGGPRTVLVCLVKPVGYLASSASFRLYSMHLKATSVASDSATRTLECHNLRNALNAAPAGTNLLLGGDSNFNGAYEGGYHWLTDSLSDNDGRLKDPFNMPGAWKNVGTYALYDTQSPCSSCPSYGPGLAFATGGMDDRFDLWLGSYSLNDGQGLDVVPGGTYAYGNDGQHFNTDINGSGFNNAVGLTVANALHEAADHLPVVTIVQLPARVIAASTLSFGSVIVGAAAQQTLAVSDGAPVPADGLDYSFSAPAGFGAPTGNFTAAAGAAPTLHAVTMNTTSAGVKSGTLTLTTDDPDSASKSVLLSGTVLRHAVASLDSLAIVTADSLDFGDHGASFFADQTVAVHDPGYDALQARLAVNTGVITGGDGHFSFVPGFSPALAGASAARYALHFDPAGATPDSTYYATLAFTDSDEPLPGAQSASPLTVTLRAHLIGSTAVGEGTPRALAFAGPRPNPLTGLTRFAFDLPDGRAVSLEIYDLAGRRVATLAEGHFEPGHHELTWSARDDRAARVKAGLYFARFETRGLSRTARLIVMP